MKKKKTQHVCVPRALPILPARGGEKTIAAENPQHLLQIHASHANVIHHAAPHLDNDFTAPVQLAKLLCDRQHFLPLSDLVLRLQVVERSVDAAYLAVGPALDAVPPA